MSRARNFAEDNSLHVTCAFPLADDDKFLEMGVVNSMDQAEVIDFIESEIGVYVTKHQISEENLGSLRAIARCVAGKQPFALG